MSSKYVRERIAGKFFENVAAPGFQSAGRFCLSILAALLFQSIAIAQATVAGNQESAAKVQPVSASDNSDAAAPERPTAGLAEGLATRPRRVTTRPRSVLTNLEAELEAESAAKLEAKLEEPKVSLPKHPALKTPVPSAEMKAAALNLAAPEENGKTAPRQFHATAYSLLGRTRSGVYVHKGVLAADPRVLPLGSVVQVNAGNYSGIYTVHDTGGHIKGNRVDVWMPSTREARRFGRRSVKLVVLRYGPGSRTPESKPDSK